VDNEDLAEKSEEEEDVDKAKDDGSGCRNEVEREGMDDS
jgi:hypothetical protein